MNSGQHTARIILACLAALLGGYYLYVYLRPVVSGAIQLDKSTIPSPLHTDTVDMDAVQHIIGHEKAQEAILRLTRYIKEHTQFQACGCTGPRNILLYGPDGNGKRLLTRFAAAQGCFDYIFLIKAYTPAADIIQYMQSHDEQGTSLLLIWEQFDAWLKLHSPEDINTTIDALVQKSVQGKPVVCVATASSIQDITNELLQALFERQIAIENPSVEHRAQFLERLCQQRAQTGVQLALDIPHLARETYGLSYGQIAALVDIALVHFAQASDAGLTLTTQDMLQALDIMRKEITKNSTHEGVITFADVAGMDQIKAELVEIVHMLQHPQAYQATGARLPRGLLLTGDPGNGKTYMARALAGEAGCSFVYISASELHQKYVGESAEKIRKTFAQALAQAPCIMFIDEIDAIGSSRSFGDSTAALAYRETLNQLLTELDGFKQHSKPLFVIAATNKPEDLDHALTRPGRFDRQIKIDYPGIQDRKAILTYGLRKIPCDATVDVDHVARATYGFSAASLTTLCNEAALMAARDNRTQVTLADIDNARDRLTLGLENRALVITPTEKEKTAYHEAGHALAQVLEDDCSNQLYKVTVVPRAMALGLTHYMPDPEKQSYLLCNYEAIITSMLGGRAAEELIYKNASSGASNDLEQATKVAYNMVCRFGMSRHGLRSINVKDAATSEDTKQRIELEVNAILDKQYQRALTLLRTHIDKLHALAHALLEKETLTAQEVYALVGKPMPKGVKDLMATT